MARRCILEHNLSVTIDSFRVRLQLKLEGKAYLIVDEMSMIGHEMFYWLYNRLRAGTGNKNKPFCEIWVILLCDFGQLLPVGDWALYVSGNG